MSISYHKVTKENIHLLENFFANHRFANFRYYEKRSFDVIQNHLITLLIRDDEKQQIFGYMHIDYDKMNDRYWFGICIIPEYQGRGYGYKLMTDLLSFDEIEKIEKIHLSVDKMNNQAIRLYEKIGFQKKEEYEYYWIYEFENH